MCLLAVTAGVIGGVMVSLDLRTRTDDEIRNVTPRSFFDRELPLLFDEHGELAIAGRASSGQLHAAHGATARRANAR